jgi:hypothetical protein
MVGTGRGLGTWAGLGALSAWPFCAGVALAADHPYFEPPRPAKPPELDFAKGWDERREWQAPTMAELATWRAPRSPAQRTSVEEAFLGTRFPHLTRVTFNGPGAQCLEVLPGQERAGGRVTVGRCSGLATQIFWTDRHSLRGSPIIVSHPMADGGLLCLDVWPLGGVGERELRLDHCDPLKFQTGSQSWWLRYARPWPRQQPPRLIPVEIATRGPLCVAVSVSSAAVVPAGLGECRLAAGTEARSSWVIVERPES